MNAHTTIAPETEPAAESPAWARPVMARQLEVLGELAEAGLRMALAIEGHTTAACRPDAAPPDAEAAELSPPLGELAMAYARAARAVRLTVLLQSRVIQDIQALDDGVARFDARAAEEMALDSPEYRRKARVERIVERLAEAARPEDEDAVDRLVIEAGERLDDEDLYGDLLSRPMGEIVARLCRDLGLDPDWTRLAEEAWALDEIAAGPPGSPFTRPPDNDASGDGSGTPTRNRDGPSHPGRKKQLN